MFEFKIMFYRMNQRRKRKQKDNNDELVSSSFFLAFYEMTVAIKDVKVAVRLGKVSNV